MPFQGTLRGFGDIFWLEDWRAGCILGSLHVIEQLVDEAGSFKHRFPLVRGTADGAEVLHLLLANIEQENDSLHKEELLARVHSFDCLPVGSAAPSARPNQPPAVADVLQSESCRGSHIYTRQRLVSSDPG